jgi:osmotically-inducible protein OsmY
MKSLKTVVSDFDLCDAVEEELSWDPRVDVSRIRVAATDGAIALSGSVESYRQKAAAVRAAERIHGVKAVADDIQVVLPDAVKRHDAAIAAEIARQREWNTAFPDSVVVEVSKGTVTLRGDVPWSYQRSEAARAMRHLQGVRNVSNEIQVRPGADLSGGDVEHRIAQALERQADVDASSIGVTASDGGVVRLHGTVASVAERRLAELAAESAPGVVKVVNDIDVSL